MIKKDFFSKEDIEQNEHLFKHLFDNENNLRIIVDKQFEIVAFNQILTAIINKALNPKLELIWKFASKRYFRDYIAVIISKIPLIDFLDALNLSIADLEPHYQYTHQARHVDWETSLAPTNYISIFSSDYQFMRGNYLYVYTKEQILYTIHLTLNRPLMIYNLKIPTNTEVYLGLQGKLKVKIKQHDKFIITARQKLLFWRKKIVKKKQILYAQNGDLKPQKLIVVCPYKQIAHSATPLTIIEYKKLRQFKNTQIISLIDKYDTYGLYDDSDNFIFEEYVKFIEEKRNKYQLTNQDIIFVGFSKGGSMCLNFYKFFKDSYFVVGTPQLNQITFAMNHSYALNYISKQKFAETIDYLVHEQMIADFIKLPNTFCFFAKDDKLSNARFVPPQELTVAAPHEHAAREMDQQIIEFISKIIGDDNEND
ncbi:MAG: hypothetical protein ACRCUP_03350 [Mycoplasmatales bacterium]